MRVRELPPLRLHVLATTPSGYTFRWGDDERRADSVPSGLSFSSIVPGGFESLECELPRKVALDYADLRRLTTLTAIGPGGRIAAEARLEKAPRVSGETLAVSPQAVGHQAHLADDEGAAEVYVDRDLSHWGDASLQRKINVAATSEWGSFAVEVDTTTGAPGLFAQASQSPLFKPRIEAWYDAGAAASVGSFQVKPTLVTFGLPDASLTHDGSTCSDDVATGFSSNDFKAVNGVTTTFDPTDRRWLMFELVWDGATGSGSSGVTYGARWQDVVVFGSHGLTKRGTAPNQGFYASDVIANAIGRWAPRLRFTTGSQGTIAPTSFVIPQLAFLERTTADAIIKEADRFHLWDWAVWEGSQPNQPTFYYQDRGARGKRWRARVRPANLEETGPQLDKLFNGVYVRYTDAAGTTFTVGPTGTSANTTSASLIDTDPLNPANQTGIRRYTTLDMGIMSTAEAATEVGRRFLEQSRLHDNSGSAEIVGHVEDDRGVVHPAWAVRAGDEITFTDAADPSYRRIVHTSYDHDNRTNSLDLDSPPEGLESLLERLGVAIAPGAPSVASAAVSGSGQTTMTVGKLPAKVIGKK